MQLGVEIPKASLDAIEARAQRLIEEVEKAVQHADRRIKTVGGQLVERILEWVEEIKDLREMGDEDAGEVMQSFLTRLRLAERMVSRWPTRRARKRRRAA